jgi:thymidylate synthase (FAD)
MPQIQNLNAQFVAMTPDPLKVIERAGRVCYKSEDRITDESAEAFVRGIIKRGHDAVIEHATATFHIICDRGVSHETVRHRLASFCQESTRYCNYAKNKFGDSRRKSPGQCCQFRLRPRL